MIQQDNPSHDIESMIVVQITHTIRPECIDTYVNATIALATATQQEQGNLRFDLLQNSQDPFSFQLYEVYVDQAAQKIHLASTHFATWKETVNDVFADRSIARFTAVSVPKVK